MCNLFEHYRAWDEYARLMQAEALDIAGDPQDLPLAPIHPSELTPVVSAAGAGSRLDLLPWGWAPPPGRGGLVINVRSENRRDPPAARGFTIPAAFYEYTGSTAPKSQWRFTPMANEPMAFAVVRKGGACALMTCPPGEDVRPIHGRQPVLIPQSSWRRWLTDPAWPSDLVQPSPAGTLRVEQTR